MFSTSDFRNGLKILFDGVPYEITYFQHVKPGKGGAFVRTKLRNLKTQTILDKTFRAGEKVGRPDLTDQQVQFLYQDDGYHFMNTETYEQFALSEAALGDKRLYLKENTIVTILTFNGEVIGIDLPSFIVFEVTECEPGVKGDTVSGATKPAILESGAKVQVPLFINQGDSIKVDTRSGDYIERA